VSRGGAVLLVAAAAFVAHLRALAGDWVYDDHRFIERNPSIESFDDPLRWFTDLSTTAAPDAGTRDIYRPLRTFSYAALRALFGEGPKPIHLLSITLHAGTTALLLALLLRAGVGTLAASLAALLFGLHPVTVEATAWCSSLGDVLCGFFAAASLLAHAGGRRGAALALLLPALLSKEHAIVVPLLWLAHDHALGGRKLPRAALFPFLPGAILVLAFLLFRRSLGAGIGQAPEPLGGSHFAAALTMLSALGFYAASVLVPSGPTFDARVLDQQGFSLPVLLGLLVLVAILFGALRGRPRVRVGCLWILLGLLPVSNVFAPLKIPTADRFLYLPLLGVAFVAADFLDRPSLRTFGARAAWAPLLLLALLTARRIGDWRNDESLNEARRRVAPKAMTGLWADAAAFAKRALAAYEQEQADRGDVYLKSALDLYAAYLRNAAPEERVQVHLEAADLLFVGGIAAQRRDRDPEFELLYKDSLDHYAAAHALQLRGKGRVLRPEVEHAADRILELCVRLANPGRPDLKNLSAAGWSAGRFLESEFPERVEAHPEDAFRGAQLLLVVGIAIRAEDTAKAREFLEGALRKFTELEERRRYVASFQRAQCRLYLSILRDRDRPDREGLREAHDLFLRAAGESAENRSRSVFLAGRSRCIEGRLFGDDRAIEEGLALLAQAEGFAESRRLRNEIVAERDTCSAR
jgi:hypothetical protein